MSSLDEIRALFRRALPGWRVEHGVATVSIFGSVARGDDTEASDVDVLVEFARPTDLFAMASLKAEMEELCGRKVDLVSRSALDQKPRLLSYVLEDAVPV